MAQFHLFVSNDLQEARRNIESVAGRLTQIFTPTLFEALLPDDADPSAIATARLVRDFATIEDADSRLVGEAWFALDTLRLERLNTEAEVIAWDDPRFLPPGRFGEPDTDEEGFRIENTGTPTSRMMTGSVAVAVVIVSGPGDLLFNPIETMNTISQTALGIQILVKASPEPLVFEWSLQYPIIDVPPPPGDCPSYEACEAVWRNPVLGQLGYPGGMRGCREYAEALRRDMGTDWAYIAFFIKYPAKHFAYASGPRLCMQYSNDGWGPGKIGHIFAHESCHIFGAQDEYDDCGCGGSGEYDVPNRNCRNCTPLQVPCLMWSSADLLCPWTQGQIGWIDLAEVERLAAGVTP